MIHYYKHTRPAKVEAHFVGGPLDGQRQIQRNENGHIYVEEFVLPDVVGPRVTTQTKTHRYKLVQDETMYGHALYQYEGVTINGVLNATEKGFKPKDN